MSEAVNEFESEKSILEEKLKNIQEKYLAVHDRAYQIYNKYIKDNPDYWVPFIYFRLYLNQSKVLFSEYPELSQDEIIKKVLKENNQPTDSGLKLVKLTKKILEYKNEIEKYTSQLKIVENSLNNHLK